MRRLLFINYEYPPLGGGAGQATFCLAREMARLGFSVAVLTSGGPALPAVEERDGVLVRRIPALRRRRDGSSIPEMLVFLLSSLVFAPLWAQRWLPDTTIAFFGLPCGPAAWAVKVATGAPYLVSLRGGDVPGFPCRGLPLYHRLARPVIRALWRRAAAVVANGDDLAALARRSAGRTPITVLRNGVDVARFHPPAPEAGESGRPLRLLCVGRLVHQKGIDRLLDAVARLPAAVALTIAGDGPERRALEHRTTTLGLSNRVRFVGWLDREDMPALYRTADVFVLPSHAEGVSNALLEAMASGLAVVASRIPGCTEVVEEGDSGLLVEPGNAADLAAALERLLRDRAERERLGANARRAAVARFSWSAAAAVLARTIDATAPPPAFDFGENWDRFSRHALGEPQVAAAMDSMAGLVGRRRLEGARVGDVGCGSGLFSVAAARLGAAQCTAFDVDPRAVAVARRTVDRFAGPAAERISLAAGSILDPAFTAKLGRFDVVYAWGCLHHTGAMWRAVDAAADLVDRGGTLVVALYARHWTSPFWAAVKRIHHRLPPLGRTAMSALFALPIFLAVLLVARRWPLDKERGMSFWYDLHDWLGGYPYECADAAEVVGRAERLGFRLIRMIRPRAPTGCNEFVFERRTPGEPDHVAH